MSREKDSNCWRKRKCNGHVHYTGEPHNSLSSNASIYRGAILAKVTFSESSRATCRQAKDLEQLVERLEVIEMELLAIDP